MIHSEWARVQGWRDSSRCLMVDDQDREDFEWIYHTGSCRMCGMECYGPGYPDLWQEGHGLHPHCGDCLDFLYAMETSTPHPRGPRPACHDQPMTWWELVRDWVCDPCGRVGDTSDCSCGCPKPTVPA